MPFDASVRAYLRAYQNEYRAALHGGQHTAELSFRVPMHEMFRRIAHDLNPAGTFDIILEPRNQGRMGRPDWRIQDRISLGVYGYIEAKGPSNEPFDTTPYRDQINRYLTLGHKLIITDGIDFVFCFTETPVVVSIIDKARMDALDWSRLPVDPLFRFYMEQFFSNPAPQRVDEEKLVELVAIRTRNLADEIRGYSDLTIEEAMNEDEHHKPVVESKILAFQNALNTCTSRQELDSVLAENIRPCSFRPFVNSNALLWGTIFDYQAGIGGGGARVRPEIKAVYDLPDTVGFSLAHAPKDLDESLGQFTSFCWYFPDNDLSRRGNGHIYLNHYIRDVHTNAVINNIHQSLIERYSALTGLDDSECAKKMVFYSYAVFCSQVYLEEFYGALFVVNQSESRARIPIVDDAGLFLRLAELGERLAILEKNDAAVDNVLDFNYDELLAQMWTGFHLEHSRSASRSPYDEENEQLIVRDEVTGNSIRIYCPVSLQKFTIAGYNVIKDCWLKFHSYRFTHCDFTRDDLKELLDLFNKIASQMGIVSEIDEIMHSIVGGEVALLNYND